MIVEWTPIAEQHTIPPFGKSVIDHISKNTNQERFNESCSVWWLLYNTLRNHHIQCSDISFEENGKPYFVDEHCYFSITHCKNVCAVAISDFLVGVDMESCNRKFNDSLMNKVLTQQEKEVFQADFIRAWCRKESVVKMTGEGITGYPMDIDILDGSLCFQEQIVIHDNEEYLLTVCSKVK